MIFGQKNHVFWKHVKGNVLLNNLSIFLKGCKISFELQISGSSTLSEVKTLIKFYQRNYKLSLLNGPYSFHWRLNFWTTFSFSLLWLYFYINVLHHTYHLWSNMFKHIYAYACSLFFKKTSLCEIDLIIWS